jgi:hypothetical protein
MAHGTDRIQQVGLLVDAEFSDGEVRVFARWRDRNGAAGGLELNGVDAGIGSERSRTSGLAKSAGRQPSGMHLSSKKPGDYDGSRRPSAHAPPPNFRID